MRDRSSWKLVTIAVLAVVGFILAGGLVVRNAMQDAATTQLRADLAPLNRTVAELRETLRDARDNPTSVNAAAVTVAGQAYRRAARDAQANLELPETLKRTIHEATSALGPAQVLAGQTGSGPFLLKAEDAADALSTSIESVSTLDSSRAASEVLTIDDAVDIQTTIVAGALSSGTVLTPQQRTQLETTLSVEAEANQQYKEFAPADLTQRLDELNATPSQIAFHDTVLKVLSATTPAEFGVTPEQFDAMTSQYETDRSAFADDLRDSIAQAASQAAQTSVTRAWITSVLIVIAIVVVIALTWLLGSDIIRQQRRTNALNADLDLRAAELARSNADLHNFANAASHDLKEPLRMVSMLSSRLTEAYPVGSVIDERAVTYLTGTRDSADRMTVLLADLLTYAQTAQTDPTQFGAVDVAEVVAQSWESNSARVLETHATLAVTTALPTLTNASRVLLGQVFANLFSNAIKYCEPGVAPVVTVSAEQAADCWRFAVADNGIGIEPQYREQIFEIFKRLHGPAEYEGTGVGLALVENIVAAHGGSISVTTNPAGGSTFTFTICDEARVHPEGPE